MEMKTFLMLLVLSLIYFEGFAAASETSDMTTIADEQASTPDQMIQGIDEHIKIITEQYAEALLEFQRRKDKYITMKVEAGNSGITKPIIVDCVDCDEP
jgi:hypothetical protein